MDEIAETQRLAGCLRLEAPDALSGRLAEYTPEDWDATLRQGRRHGLLPLLHARLGRFPTVPGLLPEQLNLLKRQYLNSLGRSLILYRRLETIIAALAPENLDVILLKGAHLARWVYGDIALRPMGDLDLLVRRLELARAAEILAGLGYAPVRPYDVETELRQHQHVPPYTAEGTMVELHAGLASPLSRLNVDVDGLWERSSALPGTAARALCPEDLLLHLSLHLLQDEFHAGLKIVFDVAQALECCSGRLDGDALVRRSEAWGLRRGLFLALHLAGELFAAPVDPHLLRKLHTPDFSDDIAVLARERVLTLRADAPEVHPDVARLLRKRPLREKAQRLWLALAPVPEYIARKYDLPAGSAKVYPYYLVRWWDMLREYGGQVFRLANCDPAALEGARRENLLERLVHARLSSMDNPENSSLPRESITSKVVRGGAWMYSRMLLTNLINLGVMAILARRLTPAEFGLVALAQVSLQLLVVLGSEGINEFVIYDNQEGRERRAQAAFWMDLVFAAGAAAVGLLLAPLAARFYGEPQLAPILIAMLLRYPIDTLSKVPDALLKKRLDFHKLVIRDTVLEIAMSLASVALALTGWGVWSLVLPGMMASPVRAVVVMRMARWRPGLNFHFSHWPRIFKYTANIIGGTLTSFILNEGDTVLIGRLMGSYTLGVYNLAWQSANLVPRNLNGIINRIALPAFSAVAGDPERLLAGFNRITRLVSILAFPPLIGLFVVADDFILTLYGPQWQGAVLPLRILIIYALRYSVGSPAGPLYKAAGRTDYTFRLGLINVPFYLISIWLGSYWGIVGVAAGITLSRTLFGLIGYVLAARCMHTRFMKIVEPLVPAFLASLWMAGVVLAAKLLLDALIPQSALVRLLTLVALGGLTYLILLRTAYKDLAEDLARVTAPLSGPWHVWVRRALNTS